MKKTIDERINALRLWMKNHGLSAFIVPSTDPHCGEYIPERWESRRWLSGFGGSAGTVVVSDDDAALWTDSRYFIAAAEQLQGTGIRLMRDGLPDTPSIAQWLTGQLAPGSTVGTDGWVNTVTAVEALQTELSAAGLTLRTDLDPTGELWKDRPGVPPHPATLQPLALAGLGCREKLEQIRRATQELRAEAVMLSALDEIAWTLNLRGTDVHCNPVFVSYLLVGTDGTATLFADACKLTSEIRAYLAAEGVSHRPYEEVTEALAAYRGNSICLNPAATNHALYSALPQGCRVVRAQSPVARLKAIKNEAEIAGYRRAMLRDGVAMVKFLRWLKPAVEAGGETEISIDRKLTALRAEQERYCDISFDTIAGYGPHGAIVHYEATPETDAPLEPRGLLLLDSGAQYRDGTTDITRTIALGPLTDEERRDYTLVLKGHICLARAKFPNGCSGTQLDVCARYAMWQEGINYLHGTGHGVGSYLNVHEGPHQVRMNYMPEPLRAGMTLTDEPGIYRAGRHGCRIENTQLIVPFRQTEFGTFLQFEPLTLCPIDKTPVVRELLSADETAWLDAYHRRVYEALAPLLDEEHRAWLQEATAPLDATPINL